MNQQMERNQRSNEDPYAEARRRMNSGKKEQDVPQRDFEDEQRKFTSALITLVTVSASVATIAGAVSSMKFPLIFPLGTTVSTSPYGPSCNVAQELRVTDGSGALDAMGRYGNVLGACPLKNTVVDAKVSGYIARVTVKQTFENTFNEKIEARYRFPLSESGAVDAMTLKIGNRVIKGEIKQKAEAARIYQEARREGKVASLLNQERTNIFTQSIANIDPGKQVEVTISYTELLNYKNGSFKFVFPTVVGPRFNPYGEQEEKIAPQLLLPWTDPNFGGDAAANAFADVRLAGHDISINVAVDAGMPIQSLVSQLHNITTQQIDSNKINVSLREGSALPNRDFVLDINVANKSLRTGYVATRKGSDGYATFMIMPPAKIQPTEIAPRELIFLVDCSGSQAGAPIQKTREMLHYVVDHVSENDTVQIIRFNDQVKALFARPEKMDFSHKMQAKMFIDTTIANGGTWMAPAVEAVCSVPPDENRLRLVSFMTDGYVSNDEEVISLVKKFRGNSRWFPVGVGDSVNRTLIEGVAKAGGGESDFVLLNNSAEEVGRTFYERIAAPVLTNVALSTEGIQLQETYPREISDVWSEKPLYFTARYSKPSSGKLIITGFFSGRPYRQAVDVALPGSESRNSQVAQIWGRQKIDYLTSLDWTNSTRIKSEILKTALSQHLLSALTAFVAVDHDSHTRDTRLVTMAVATELPQGVRPEPGVAVGTTPVSFGSSNFANSPATASSSDAAANLHYNSVACSSNPAAEKVFGTMFSGVVNHLNDLSCAAGTSNCAGAVAPSSAGTYASSHPPSSANPITFGDVVLIPWGFFPSSVRLLIVGFLALLAVQSTWSLGRKHAAQNRVERKSVLLTFFLYFFAALLLVGHLNLLNFPTN